MPIVMTNPDNLPEEAVEERQHCLKQGIKSSVLIPLAVGGSFLGVVGFACLKSERQWPDMLVQRLKMLGIVFANSLMRKTAELELHKAFSEIKNLKDRLEAENSYLREEIDLQYSHEEFIGNGDTIKDCINPGRTSC